MRTDADSGAVKSHDFVSLRRTARQAGMMYFVMSVVAIIVFFVLPKFVVAGDAEATMKEIVANEALYRLKILLGFISGIIFIALVVWLYRLFEGVDKKYALLMLLLVSIGTTVSLAGMFYEFEPLAISGNHAYLSVFSAQQLDAIGMNSVRFSSFAAYVPTTFWGLWLLPFAYLVIKSRFIPAIFGILLIAAGLAYIASGFTAIGFPAIRSAIAPVLMPLYFCEVPIIFWLMFVGIRQPRAKTGTAGA